MNTILSKTRTYSHDNGLGQPHSYKYEYSNGRIAYECINGRCVKCNKIRDTFIGTATTKQEFAYLVAGKTMTKGEKVKPVESKKPKRKPKFKIVKCKVKPKSSRAVVAAHVETGDVIEFETINLATKHTNYKHPDSLRRLIKLKLEHNGWIYKFKE